MFSLNSAVLIAIGAGVPYIVPFISDRFDLRSRLEAANFIPHRPSIASSSFTCEPHAYTTELISMDPLLIYIHDFISPLERVAIISAGSKELEPSPVTGSGTDSRSQARTSWSAPLPLNDTATNCVLDRAAAFMGTLLAPGRDEMGMAQMVHYTSGQKFDLHHDWFKQPRLKPGDAEVGRKRLYNRAATFFAVLEANCTEGETWFPAAKAIALQDRTEKMALRERVWDEHPDGGLRFKPIPGNALFWVNLFNNGSGDARTLHAGLPVGEGTKTAMNIWPRVFFGPDA